MGQPEFRLEHDYEFNSKVALNLQLDGFIGRASLI